MEKCVKIARRVAALLLCTLVLCGGLLVVTPNGQIVQTQAAATKVDKTYDIAVVYDNSGSMYMNQNKAWSQAKFAMEIFASMLDYQGGDRLTIFPMYEVAFVDAPASFDNKTNEWTGNSNYKNPSSQKVVIAGKDDIDKKIANMYTPYCGGTPDTQIFNAHNYLSSSSADEKWLIVLTDGMINNTAINLTYGPDELESLLRSKATNGIEVQYILFGTEGAQFSTDAASSFYAAAAADGKTLQKELLNICNRIFQRDELPTGYLSGNTLTLDLSMKSLIVFVQGSNAVINSLSDANGTPVGVTLDSGQRTYSKVSHGRQTGPEYDIIAWDDTLAGQVVNFADCAKGTYMLDYAGADSIQIFYEPDVKLDIKLLNAEGEEVDAKAGKLQSGDYTVNTNIVDSATGEEVTNHPLMGGNVAIKTYVTTADGNTAEYANGAKIKLTPDSKTDIRVEAEYLEIYKITSDDMADGDLPWPKGGFSVPESAEFKIEATMTQPNAEFKINDMKNWQPIKVNATLKGKPLTAEQMNSVKVTATPSNGMVTYVETLTAESAYVVWFGKDQSGNFTPPAIGDCTMKIVAEFTDEFGETFPDTEEELLHIKSIDFVMAAEVQQSGAWYSLSSSDSWKPVKVKMTVDGRALTDAELDAVTLNVTSSETLNVRVEKLAGQSAFHVYIGQNQDGSYVSPATGDYVLTLDAVIGDEYGNQVPASVTAELEVHKFGKLLTIFLIILPFLIAFLLWWFYMTRKVMPDDIVMDGEDCEVSTLSSGRYGADFVEVNLQKKSRTLNIETDSSLSERCWVSFKLEPLDNHFTKSPQRRAKIVNIQSDCRSVIIDGSEYIQLPTGVFVPEGTEIDDESGVSVAEIDYDKLNGSTIEMAKYSGPVREVTVNVRLRHL